MVTNRVLKPKVLIYKTDLLPFSETFIREQALSLKNWEAKLVGRNLIRNGLELRDLNVLLIGKGTSLFGKAFEKMCAIIGWFSRRDLLLLKKEQAQLVHVHFATEAVNIWPLIKSLNLPMIVTLHGYDINIYKEWWECGKGGLTMRNYPKRLLSLASHKNVHFIAVSEAIKRRAIEYGIPAEKLTVSYIGVNTDKFAPGAKPMSSRKKILYVGRLVEKKGCRYLLAAFQGIQDEFPHVELSIVGTGPLDNALKKYARDNEIRANFLGQLTSDQVRNEMQEARIFCLPSITAENGDAEGLPIVILEAQASGVPVITSARGVNEGILDGISGFAHPEKDIVAITNALKRLLGNDDRAAFFGQQARTFSTEKMDIRDCTAKLERLYASVAEAQRG